MFPNVRKIKKKRMKEMEHKKLHKSATDKKICGVCGGLAEYLNVDPTIIRLIWALTVVFAGTGVLAYLIAALVIPEDVTPIV